MSSRPAFLILSALTVTACGSSETHVPSPFRFPSPSVVGETVDLEYILDTSASYQTIADIVGSSIGLIDCQHEPADPLDRQHDTSPFKGGALTHDPLLHMNCTTGFTVSSNSTGVRSLTTAAHCADGNGAPMTSGNGFIQGSTAQRDCAGDDFMLITGKTYIGQIYVGLPNSSTISDVKGAGDAQAGGTYYWSGVTTGENSTTVVSVTGSASWGCGQVSNILVFQNTERGICAADHGDSGAPIYLKSGSTAYIRGMVNAKIGSYCYGETWAHVRIDLGVSIVTH